MAWHNTWTLIRKDLAEFRHQRLVLGSIIAMPLVLGVILPLFMFYPLTTLTTTPTDTWDVTGLQQYGTPPTTFTLPRTNHTQTNTHLTNQTITNTTLIHMTLSNCVIISCDLLDSNLTNCTVTTSSLSHTECIDTIITTSRGTSLSGRHIIATNTNLTFTTTKSSQEQLILPTFINLVLIIFIIIPATLPTIIASYSIVGEKNNRSLEPLLATPITDGELLTGKIFSSLIPSMGATLLAFSLGCTMLDLLIIPKIGLPLLPNLNWLLSILLLAPTACLMSILGCVIISSKVSDVRAAQQVGGFIVMPVIVLMLGVLSGLILLSPYTILAFTALYLAIDLVLFYFAKAIFNREEILTKWK
jgi:ABC-2 type transport system permease protein